MVIRIQKGESFLMNELENLIHLIKHARHAIAIYQFLDGKVKTICVSDGMYEMGHCADETDKESFLRRLNTNMYRTTVLEDAVRVAAEARRFAIEGGKYEVIYREKVNRQPYYTLTHSVGYHYYLSDGQRIAIIIYTNIDQAVFEHLRTENKLERSVTEFLNRSNISLAIVKKDDGELLYCNKSMRTLLNPVNNFDTGMTLSEFIKDKDDPSVLRKISQIEGLGNQLVRLENSQDAMFRVTSMDWDGDEVYVIESDPWDTIYQDSLTGLPNISWFCYHARDYVDVFTKEGRKLSFVYFNLCNLNIYNTKYGLSEGDRILKVVADLLKEEFPDGLMCRLSEDHFIMFTESEGLDKKLDRICEEVKKESRGGFLALKAGVSTDDGPGGLDMEDYISQAYDRAWLACGTIKDNVIKSWTYFDSKVSDEYENRIYILSNFQKAMKEGRIETYYQPIYDVDSGELTAFECLSRWNDPKRGLLSPAVFIPVLEQHHLIGMLDNYILDRICREWDLRREKGYGNIKVSFNVSRDDFNYTDVFTEVNETADKYGIPHDLIVAEITESAFSDDPDFISEQVKRFRSAGFSVWMDDFGSEYSSLGTLQKMDVDLVKLDIRFLHAVEDEKQSNSHRAADLLRASIQLVKALGLHTLCEGVENQGEMDFLNKAGCEKAQGFYLGKPLPFSAYKEKK